MSSIVTTREARPNALFDVAPQQLPPSLMTGSPGHVGVQAEKQHSWLPIYQVYMTQGVRLDAPSHDPNRGLTGRTWVGVRTECKCSYMEEKRKKKGHMRESLASNL